MELDIGTLQDPEDYLAEHGEYALFGLYMRLYWQYMEALQKHSDALDGVFRDGTYEEHQKVNAILAKNESVYESWIARAVEQLPEWAIDLLADIDVMLEQGKEI